MRIVAAVVGLVGVGVYAYFGDNVVMWWWMVVLLSGAAVFFLVGAVDPPAVPASGRKLEVLLWSTGLACVVLALIVHRPDFDDSFYINLAVAAADHPERAL